MRNVKNIGYTLFGMALPVVVMVVTVPLYLAQIGEARYGALAIAWLILGYVGQADFGISRAVTQRISSLISSNVPQSSLSHSIWSASIFALIVGIIGGSLVFLFSYVFFDDFLVVDETIFSEFSSVALILGVSVPLMNFYSLALGALLGAERVKFVAFLNSASTISLQIFPLFCAYFISYELSALVASALMARIFSTAPALFVCWATFLKGNPIQVSRTELRRLFRFGSWVMVTSLVGPFMLISDRLLIGAVIGAAAVAVYTIPFQVANRTLMLPYAVMQVMFPRFAAETDDGAKNATRNYMIHLGNIYGVVVVSVISMAGPLLNAWLGPRLDETSILIAQIIMIGLWANAIAQVPFGYIQARGNPRFTAILHVCELPGYIICLIGFGYFFGLPGMAIAFSIRCFVDLLALMHRSRLLDLGVLAQLLPALVVIGMAFVAVRHLEQSFTPYLIFAICGGLSACWAWIRLPVDARQSAYTRIASLKRDLI